MVEEDKAGDKPDEEKNEAGSEVTEDKNDSPSVKDSQPEEEEKEEPQIKEGDSSQEDCRKRAFEEDADEEKNSSCLRASHQEVEEEEEFGGGGGERETPSGTMVQAEEESPSQGSGEEGHPLYASAQTPDPYSFTPEEDLCVRQQQQFNSSSNNGFNTYIPNNGGYHASSPNFQPPFVYGPHPHQGVSSPMHPRSSNKGVSYDGGFFFIDEEHEDAGEDEESTREGKEDWSEFYGEANEEDGGERHQRLVIAEDEEDLEEGSLEESSGSLKGDEGPPPIKRAKSGRRLLPEEDIKLLPDLIRNDLDILFIGVNPGIHAALKGHHYSGPANHFWKCMLLSGLLPQAMSPEEDYKLLELGIGFTNVVQRSSRRTSQLTRKEIEDGIHSLNEKIRKYSPKIAVFNGKGIYEVFSGKKEFYFGKQPEKIPGTETHVWVLPNSSSRCAQLPSAVDKVPFYAALKKYRDLIKGLLQPEDVCEEEFVFKDVKVRSTGSGCSLPPPPPNNGHSRGGPPLPPHVPSLGLHQNPGSNNSHILHPSQQQQAHSFMNYHTVHPSVQQQTATTHIHTPPPGCHIPGGGPPLNNNTTFHPMKREHNEFEDLYEYGGAGGPPYPGNMESYYQYYDVDPVTGKKRRGRPPKPRTDGSMPPPKRKTVDNEGNPIRRGSNPIDPLTGKKKRGRPKKIEGEEGPPKSHKKATKKQQQQVVVQEEKNGGHCGGSPLEHMAGGGLSPFPPPPIPHHIPPPPSQPPLQPLPPFSPNFGRSPLGDMGGGPPKEEDKKEDPKVPEIPAPHHLHHHNSSSYMVDSVNHHPYEDYNSAPPQYSSPNYPPYAGYPQHPYETQASSQVPPINSSNNSNSNGIIGKEVSNNSSSPEDVSSKSINGLESLVDQIPALENESGVFSAGSHPATPRSVGPYSPVPTPSNNNNNGYAAYGSPGSHYGGGPNGGDYIHNPPPETTTSPSSYPSNTPAAERASPSNNSSNFSVSSLVHTPPSSGEPSDFSVSTLAASSSSSSNSSCSSSSSSSSGYVTDPSGKQQQQPEGPNSNNKYYPSSTPSIPPGNSPSGAGGASYGMYGAAGAFGGSSFHPPHHPYAAAAYGQYHQGPPYAGGFNAPPYGSQQHPPPSQGGPYPPPSYPPHHHHSHPHHIPHHHHPHYGQPPAASYPPQTPYF